MNNRVIHTFLVAMALLLCHLPARALLWELHFSDGQYHCDGIVFEILSQEDRTVQIKYCPRDYLPRDLACHLAIPDSVSCGQWGDTIYQVVGIAPSAFSYCSKVKSVTIPNTVTQIGAFAFEGSSITAVALPESVTTISEGLFQFCKFQSIKLPNSITRIENGAFRSCYYLDSLVIPESVSYIGVSAFYFCRVLRSIQLPRSLTRIEQSLFNRCDSLQDVVFPDSLKSIGPGAFAWSGLVSCVIPESVDLIEGDAFAYCEHLSSVSLPSKLRSIRGGAFSHCAVLRAIVLPDSLESIGSHAFSYSPIESLFIPKHVREVGPSVVERCQNLTSIKVDEENPVFDSRNDCNAIVERGTNTLIAACYSTKVPRDIERIGDYAFSRLQMSIDIPESVKSIGDFAFYNNLEITHLEIPDSVKTIGHHAFGYCQRLATVTFPARMDHIGDFAFSGTKLKEVKLPEGIKEISEGLFSYCTGLTRVEIPSTVEKIWGNTAGSGAFAFCSNLWSIISHAVVPPIVGTMAFRDEYQSKYEYLTPIAFDINSARLIVPEGSEAAYKAADEWKYFPVIYASSINAPTFSDNGMARVYDIHGALVSQGMRLEDMKRCLPKGVYVTNGRKVAIP